MNEPTEISELEDLLEECRNLYANLSEHNIRVVGGWPRMSEPIHLFPAAGESAEENPQRGPTEASPSPNDFGATLHQLQKQFLYNWRSLLRSKVELEKIARDRGREQSELARLSEQVMLLSQSRAEASEEKSRLRRELELLKIESTEGRETIHRLETQLALRDKDLNALAAELAEQEREHRQTEERNNELAEDIRNLERIRHELGGRLEDLEKELASLRGQVEPVENQLVEARGRVSELESELRFTREGTVPKQSLIDVSEDLERVVSENKSLHDLIHDLEETLKQKDRDNDEIARERDLVLRAKAEVDSRSDDLESRLGQSLAHIEELERLSQQSLSPSELEAIERKLTSSLTDLESYREQYHRVEQENSKLREALEKASRILVDKPEETQPTEIETFIPSIEPSSISNPSGGFIDETVEREKRVAAMEFMEIESLEAAPRETGREASMGEDRSRHDRIVEAEIVSDPPVGFPLSGLDPAFIQVEGDAPVAPEPIANRSPKIAVAAPKESGSAPMFPYPEITREGLEGLNGKHVLLVGGDVRFQQDYQFLFQLGEAEVDYFPSIIHLEKHGMKNSVREANLVVAFGGATQEPGLFRLRKICTDYGRTLLEHPSSGLVSLSQKLKQTIKEI